MNAPPNDPADIQQFNFTHVEMALISVAVMQFRSVIQANHLIGHTMGECSEGEKLLIRSTENILRSIDEKMVQEVVDQILKDALNGKYS